MISILISVYNHDPGQLIRDLSGQMARLASPGEIIVGNDKSDSTFMPFFEKLSELPFVQVFHSPDNLGRSKIRNTLAGMASFPNLLFIDGDAEIVSDAFVENYVKYAGEELVVCGGTAYSERSEIKSDEVLRWLYGVKREVRPASDRNRFPQKGFSSFNFMVPAGIFKRISFSEQISRYGHEDTVYGIELAKNNIRIKHIDNQLIHNGLDSAEVFLEKTREGLDNLLDLMDKFPDPKLLEENIRIIKMYNRFKKRGIKTVMRFVKALAGKMIIRNLKGSKPSLFLFDVYKLIVISDIQS